MAPAVGDIVASTAKALGGAKRTSNGYDCKCPAHDDKTASLSLSLGDKGKLVWRCHAGCSQESVGAALKAAGLLPDKAESAVSRRIVATYDYLDEAGDLVFQVCRLQPKDFRQRRKARAGDAPDKCRDGWCWSVKGLRVVPYRLPQVLAAIGAGQIVWVVEGEKDADNLAKLGAAATCNAGGAGKWRKEHAQALAGANVVIVPDNDEAGAKHAAAVAASLQGIARRVRVLELPGLAPKSDVSDWLAGGHGLAELAALAEGIADWHGTPPEPARPAADGWRARLIKARSGEPKALLANAALALREAAEWQGVLAFNQLKLTIEITQPPPWVRRNGAWQCRGWTDNDDVRCAEWLQRAGIEVGHTIANAAVAEAAEHNAYHPVRAYLEALVWDGIERIAYFATDVLGAEDEPLTQAISSAMLIAAVARAMTPGCKADNIPVLEGPQGKFKSTAIETLFGRNWFTDELGDLGSKDAAQQIGRAWGVEVAELASMKRPEIERVKAFASRRVDIFRPPYGRAVIEQPRQCVLWGTTNADTWIYDETGGRRFWPIRCGTIDVKRIERTRDQLWAEAVHWWRSGEPWWLADAATIALAREAQDDRQVADAWDDRIADYVRNKTDVSIGDVLQFGLVISPGDWRQADQNRVARYLRSKQWRRRRLGPKGQQKWRYYKPENEAEEQMELGYSEDMA
jgi:predicted P-loop ATPase